MAAGRIPTTANSPITAKGDLFTYSTAPARLAVGNDGETVVADSSTSSGLRYQGNYAAGKNAVINGDFTINQRNFTSATANNTYGHDRWSLQTNSTCTYSTQAFTPGTAPVAGYEGINFARMVTTTSSAAGEYAILQYKIEDVRSFAGETVTVSFWAKSGSGTPKVGTEFSSIYGSGGSGNVTGTGQSFTLSTSWTRYTATFSIGSVSGKTIGTSSYLEFNFWCAAGSTFATRSGSVGNQSATIDIWGVQIEAGNVATAFQTATGTLQGELYACKYYYNELGGVSDQYLATGLTYSTTVGEYALTYPPMRTTPSASISAVGDFKALNGSAAAYTNTAISFAYLSVTSAAVNATIGTANFTVGQASILKAANANARIKLSAEL